MGSLWVAWVPPGQFPRGGIWEHTPFWDGVAARLDLFLRRLGPWTAGPDRLCLAYMPGARRTYGTACTEARDCAAAEDACCAETDNG